MPRLTPLLLALALLGPSSVRAEEAAPRAVIERAVKALGGEEVLKHRVGVRMKVKGKFFFSPDGPAQEFPLVGETLNQSGPRVRLSFHIDLLGNKVDMVIVLDGANSWQSAYGRVQDLGPDERKSMGISSYTDRVTSLLPLLKDKAFTLSPLGEEKVEGRPAVGLKVSSKDRPDVRLYFDKESGLLVKYAYRSQSPGEVKEQLHETILSDYRRLDHTAADEQVLKAAKVGTDGPALLEYLRNQTPDSARLSKVKALVRQLGDDAFEKREEASKALAAAGVVALPFLREAAKGEDREVVRRARDCLKQIGTGPGVAVPAAVVRLLGWKRPAGAARVLLDYLPSADEPVAREVRAALVALAQRDGKSDPDLVRAVDDKDAVKREAARGALGKDGGAFLKRPGRRLYFQGPPNAKRTVGLTDGQKQMELEVVDVQYFNAFEDREFARPQPDGARRP
jgi:hypothetical protein